MTTNQSQPGPVWPFYLISFAALALLVMKLALPKLAMDGTALSLFGISCVAAILPRLAVLLPNVKSVKVGDFEAEFDTAIGSIEKKVAAHEREPVGPAPVVSDRLASARPEAVEARREIYYERFQKILTAPMSNREKIVSAAMLVERMAIETARARGLQADPKNARAAIAELCRQGTISTLEQSALDEFLDFRNRAIHGKGDISDSQTARLLDIVSRLMRSFG